MLKCLLKYSLSPKHFQRFAQKSVPILWTVCLLTGGYGLVSGLLFTPADYQQGEAYRIIYVHVPCAVLSLFVFLVMTCMSILHLVWKIRLADIFAEVSAPVGANFTALALITGALWGKPMWGTFWIWDARLTAELILLFLYLGIIALRAAIPNKKRAGMAANILILVGSVDIPIIHYSVNWWNTLHQKASLLQFAKPTLDTHMLYPLLAMLGAFFLYYFAILLMQARKMLLQDMLAHEKRQAMLSPRKSSHRISECT